MAESVHEPPKADPETLVLRGAPRRVIRFKRNLLIGSVGVVALVVSAVMAFALQSPAAKSRADGQEIYNVDRKTTADALAAVRILTRPVQLCTRGRGRTGARKRSG